MTSPTPPGDCHPPPDLLCSSRTFPCARVRGAECEASFPGRGWWRWPDAADACRRPWRGRGSRDASCGSWPPAAGNEPCHARAHKIGTEQMPMQLRFYRIKVMHMRGCMVYEALWIRICDDTIRPSIHRSIFQSSAQLHSPKQLWPRIQTRL